MRAAEALEKVFRQHPDVSEVKHVDALQFTNKLFRDFYSSLYIRLVRSAPTLLGWMYKTSDEPWKTDRTRIMLDRLNTVPMVKFINNFAPDITVCTHFLPAGVISHLISTHRLKARLSIVVTDFDLHAMWLAKAFHRYFVAIEETKCHLEYLGFPSDRITISGIPVDPLFHPPQDRASLKKKEGFDPAVPVLLVSAGAMGVSPAEGVLDGLCRLKSPAQAIIVCGKNVELHDKLKAVMETRLPAHVKVRLLGFTNEMHRWMAVSDLFIGKPGGLTTSEALAVGLPMAVVSPIPGQEERNSDHLLEKGIAIKCNEFTTLPYKLDQLLQDPERMKMMSQRAREYGHPDAAEIVVRTLLQDELAQPPLIRVEKEQQEEMVKLAKPGRA